MTVRVDGEYDYVDHHTRKRRVHDLQQEAVHSGDVTRLKHGQGCQSLGGSPFQACSCAGAAVQPAAEAIVAAAKRIAKVVAREEDVQDRSWDGLGEHPILFLLGSTLDASDDVDTDQARAATALIALANATREIVADEPMVLQAPAPAQIFGDLHGQLRDLLLWFQDFGFPHASGPSFVFNGDWVDRGRHQLETVALVFALKVSLPGRVFLVRGNHEFQGQNEFMGAAGFKAACLHALGRHGNSVFLAFQNAFNYLPFSCLVAQKILCLHGGIGDGEWDLAMLANAARPIDDSNVKANLYIYNILWSDPIPETVEESFGVHDSPRDNHKHMIRSFGQDVTEKFCQRNNIEMIVRSHQARIAGYGYEIMHGNRLVRVFSARDYEGHRNDGAMLKVRWSRGGKLVVRPQVLQSLMRPRDPSVVEGTVAEAPSTSGMICCR